MGKKRSNMSNGSGRKAAAEISRPAARAVKPPRTGAHAPRSDARPKTARQGRGAVVSYRAGTARNRHLVIVESPAKAKTINKYLGPEYVVLASVGHVRDLPTRNPRGVKAPVPGVDLEHDFRPTYQIVPGKEKIVAALRRAAAEARRSGKDVWFATDLDREGEAIAWHLAQELGIEPTEARRVIFAAITRDDIARAFARPHAIDLDKVNAQQARRILDRIVGYQVSPLLWRKVARGLSAGRVQSVAVRLIVEREREIRAFVPDEQWTITGYFALSEAEAVRLGPAWAAFRAQRDARNMPPTIQAQNAWLSEARALRAELVEFDGRPFAVGLRIEEILGPIQALTPETTRARLEQAAEAFAKAEAYDLTPTVADVARACGLRDLHISVEENSKGRGPARWIRTITGQADPRVAWSVQGIERKRMSVRPPPPFITSTLQQAASTRLGFSAQRTMRTAQQLYEGVEIPGEGPVGLITYMRTDSTHLADDAIRAVREYLRQTFGERYVPERPHTYASAAGAQEAHEAIRPTSLDYPPQRVRRALTSDQFRLYSLIWERFLACQMPPAEWESTQVLIRGGEGGRALFKTSGRVLVFDGFYRVAGMPRGDELTLPALTEGRPLSAFAIEPAQRFSQPPPRYTEASLIKTLESEGIGRPSTYAQIIDVIQKRRYVEQIGRRFHATDLGEVVTDKLIEAFPEIMDVGYTREMEAQLDQIEEVHLDWVEMLRRFYGPFKESLARAHEALAHARAETTPAPDDLRCPQCGSGTVYRFGRRGRFLSCARYPECRWASPVDKEGRPRSNGEPVNVACPRCGGVMTRRHGRFGPFLGCSRYGDKTSPCDGVLNLDRKGRVTAPPPPPLLTDLPCPACRSPMHLRAGVRGPWLGCSRFPTCRGRGKWSDLPPATRHNLDAKLADLLRTHPVPIIRTLDGQALTDARGRPRADAPSVEQLVMTEESGESDDRVPRPPLELQPGS